MRTVILRLACCGPGLALLLWPSPAVGDLRPPEPSAVVAAAACADTSFRI
jgi:hypothetical protein